MWQFGSAWAKRDGDGSGAGSDIHDARGRVVFQPHNRCFDEVFRLGTRNQNIGRDVKRQAVKFLLSGDVLDGLALRALLDQGVEFFCLGGSERALPGRMYLGRGNSQYMPQQQYRIVAAIARAAVGLVKRGCTPADRIADRHRLREYASHASTASLLRRSA